jgi:hypothetical protein
VAIVLSETQGVAGSASESCAAIAAEFSTGGLHVATDRAGVLWLRRSNQQQALCGNRLRDLSKWILRS